MKTLVSARRLLSLGCLCGCLMLSLLASPAKAWAMSSRGPVINQPFDTIANHFGHYFTEKTYPQGEETWTERTYSTEGLHLLIPTLPDQAVFKIIFVDGRAQWLALHPAVDYSMATSADEGWSDFTYDEAAASAFFEYVFGYPAPTYTPVPGFSGGGTGFVNRAVCLGDGVQTTYTEYLFGYGDIRLSYNMACDAY